jgi:hypothetical protein
MEGYVPERKKSNTPIDEWSYEDWMRDGVWGDEEDDDGKGTVPLSFRLSKRLMQLMAELREDPASPYFGMFRTRSSLMRHILVRGLVELGEHYRETQGDSRAIRLRESVLALATSNRESRKLMNHTVTSVISSAIDAFDDGEVVTAAKILDKFFERIAEWEDEEESERYAQTLLFHPAMKRLKDNPVLRECSRWLGDFNKKYGAKEVE